MGECLGIPKATVSCIRSELQQHTFDGRAGAVVVGCYRIGTDGVGCFGKNRACDITFAPPKPRGLMDHLLI